MLSFVYICIAIGDPEGRVVILLTGLTQTHFMPYTGILFVKDHFPLDIKSYN
jgi:hypothetical protein